MPIGQNIVHLAAVDSTNNYAATMLRQGIIGHGAVILADEQESGRGQRGAEWHSEPGMNLLVSICLKPDKLSVHQQFVLTQLASLALVELLKNFGIQAKIKWPNDIYVDNKKIAGILIENSISGEYIVSSVVGIGLNANQTEFNGLNATSVKLIHKNHLTIKDILMGLLDNFNAHYDLYLQHAFDALHEKYSEALFRRDILSDYSDQNGIFKGTVKGVNGNGELLVQIDNQLKNYNLKEIAFIL